MLVESVCYQKYLNLITNNVNDDREMVYLLVKAEVEAEADGAL